MPHLCEDIIDDVGTEGSYAKCIEVDGKLEIEIYESSCYYTYTWPVKYCPFCGYRVPFKRSFKCDGCGIPAPDKDCKTQEDYEAISSPMRWILYKEQELCEDLQRKDRYVFQDYDNRTSGQYGSSIPLRYLCKSCAIKEKDLVIDNIASKLDLRI